MRDDEFVASLRSLALFATFNAEEIESLLELVEVVSFPPGDHIVRQDDPGDCMYVLLEGTADVVHHSGGRDFGLATLGPGDFFGELALVDHGPRSADVIAVVQCSLLRVAEPAMRALAGTHPGAAFKLLIALGRSLVSRLRFGNQKYIDSLLSLPGKA